MPKLRGSQKRKRGNSAGADRPRKKTLVPRSRAVQNGAEEQEEKEDDFVAGDSDSPMSSDDEATTAGRADADGAQEETAEEKRLRVAHAYIDRLKAIVQPSAGGEGNEAGLDGGKEGEPPGEEGHRDSLVAAQLRQQQLETSGRVLRRLAARVHSSAVVGDGRTVGRRHRQTVTAVALGSEDATAFAASKDGLIVQWNVESGASDKYEWPPTTSTSGGALPARGAQSGGRGGARKQGHGQQQSRHVLALAISSDGRYLSAGGHDRLVHVWDTRTRQHLQAFRGHRGSVTALAFRQGTSELFSASSDRSIKVWSCDDLAYMDSLYGHQSEVVALDCLRAERVLSAGRDRTCRVWKVPDETQLVFRGHAASIDCCAMISGADFISGADDGSVALWSVTRKKPVHIVRMAHDGREGRGQVAASPQQQALGANGVAHEQGAARIHAQEHNGCSQEHRGAASDEQGPASSRSHSHMDEGSCGSLGPKQQQAQHHGGMAQHWISAAAVCRGSDLAATGAGDGYIRLWGCDVANRALHPVLQLPTRGFVNSLAIASSGKFLIAGVGQEPRLGRWGRLAGVRNEVVLHNIPFKE